MDDYHNFFAAEAIAKLCREGRCDLQLSRYVVYDSFISIFWCTFGVTRLIFRPTVIKAETDERLLRCWCCQRYTTVKDFPPIKTPHYVWKVLHETLGLWCSWLCKELSPKACELKNRVSFVLVQPPFSELWWLWSSLWGQCLLQKLPREWRNKWNAMPWRAGKHQQSHSHCARGPVTWLLNRLTYLSLRLVLSWSTLLMLALLLNDVYLVYSYISYIYTHLVSYIHICLHYCTQLRIYQMAGLSYLRQMFSIFELQWAQV